MKQADSSKGSLFSYQYTHCLSGRTNNSTLRTLQAMNRIYVITYRGAVGSSVTNLMVLCGAEVVRGAVFTPPADVPAVLFTLAEDGPEATVLGRCVGLDVVETVVPGVVAAEAVVGCGGAVMVRPAKMQTKIIPLIQLSRPDDYYNNILNDEEIAEQH